ncbi:Zinc-binding oxidoreductase alcohol dehydrogenase [Cystobasidiomycetes sp. EMM_F5]
MSSAAVPDKMRAAVIQDDKTVKVQEKPVPKDLKDNEVLIKVVAVGENPTYVKVRGDWKHAAFIGKPGDISGCDFVGRIVEAGPSVPQDVRTDGKLRGGFVRGGFTSDNGAFAEYVKAEWDLTFEVPDNITAQQAASAPIPLLTVCQAFFLRLGLPKPAGSSNKSQYTDKWFLVWSGSSSVGQYAIQVAKAIGFRVATVASENKHDLVKSLGAEVVFNYKDPEVSEKLNKATNNGIIYGMDTIAEGGSVQKAQKAFSTEGGHLVLTLFDKAESANPKVKTEATLVYTGLGKDQSFGSGNVLKTSPEDRQNTVDSCKAVTDWFKKGTVKPLKVEDFGGLETVQKAMDTIKSGQHGGKIVHTV